MSIRFFTVVKAAFIDASSFLPVGDDEAEAAEAAEAAESASDDSVDTDNAIGAHVVTASIAAMTAAAVLIVFAFAFDRFILSYPFRTAAISPR